MVYDFYSYFYAKVKGEKIEGKEASGK